MNFKVNVRLYLPIEIKLHWKKIVVNRLILTAVRELSRGDIHNSGWLVQKSSLK